MDADDLRDRLDGRAGVHVFGAASFLAVYAFFVRDVTVGRVYAFGDLSPYFGEQAIQAFVSTWHFQQLGYSYYYGVLPAYFGTVTLIGGTVAQNLVYLALLPAAFATFFVLSGRFVHRLPARYLAAGLYAINPVTIGEFVNGSVGHLLGLVGIPLVVHYLYRVVERNNWTDSLKAGAVFGATAVVPWLGFWMILPFGTYLAYRARTEPRALAKLFAAGVTGVVLSLPNVHHILQRAGQFDTVRETLFNTLLWNYSQADALAVLRLSGNRGLQAANELGYNDGGFTAIGLVIPLVAILAIHREDLRIFYVVIVSVVGFMVLTAQGVTHPLFDAFPPLWSIRNPVKLQYPLALSVCVCFGAGIQTLLGGVPELSPGDYLRSLHLGDPSHLRSGALVCLIGFSLIAYAAPAAGSMGLEQVRGENYYVPEETIDVAEGLEGRVIWVPYGYTTQLRLRYAYSNHVGVKSGGRLHGIQNTAFVTKLFDDFAAGAPTAARLDELGVQYVVVDGNPPDRYASGEPRTVDQWGAPWLWGAPARFEAMLNESSSFSLAYRTENYAVYEVAGAEPTERTSTYAGLHSVIYPEEPTADPIGDNLVANPSFERGLEVWWTPPEERGTRVRAVNDSNDETAAAMTTAPDATPLAMAQRLPVRSDAPYVLTVEGEGGGSVELHWLETDGSSEEKVGVETILTNETPTVIIAKGNELSLRIRPNDRELLVREVTLRRSAYPPATTLEASAVRIPGVVVDGRETDVSEASVVAVNLPDGAAPTEADVRIVDAEGVLDGELVFDDGYRQGVAVKVPGDDRPAAIPDDATVVSHETDDGTVIDYWVEGEFDDTPVTVLHTSYDDRWVGPPGSTHFEAGGWANGFLDAEPDEIEWSGDSSRREVIAAWLASWLLVVGSLTGRWIWQSRIALAERLAGRGGAVGPRRLL